MKSAGIKWINLKFNQLNEYPYFYSSFRKKNTIKTKEIFVFFANLFFSRSNHVAESGNKDSIEGN